MDHDTAFSEKALIRAIEGRDSRTLAGFYTNDAVLRIIDRNNPPRRPRTLTGSGAIAAFWEDVCGRDMTHRVASTVARDDQLAFTEDCTYPDGTTVFCASMLQLDGGRIGKQTIIQAWDE